MWLLAVCLLVGTALGEKVALMEWRAELTRLYRSGIHGELVVIVLLNSEAVDAHPMELDAFGTALLPQFPARVERALNGSVATWTGKIATLVAMLRADWPAHTVLGRWQRQRVPCVLNHKDALAASSAMNDVSALHQLAELALVVPDVRTQWIMDSKALPGGYLTRLAPLGLTLPTWRVGRDGMAHDLVTHTVVPLLQLCRELRGLCVKHIFSSNSRGVSFVPSTNCSASLQAHTTRLLESRDHVVVQPDAGDFNEWRLFFVDGVVEWAVVTMHLRRVRHRYVTTYLEVPDRVLSVGKRAYKAILETLPSSTDAKSFLRVDVAAMGERLWLNELEASPGIVLWAAEVQYEHGLDVLGLLTESRARRLRTCIDNRVQPSKSRSSGVYSQGI